MKKRNNPVNATAGAEAIMLVSYHFSRETRSWLLAIEDAPDSL